MSLNGLFVLISTVTYGILILTLRLEYVIYMNIYISILTLGHKYMTLLSLILS